MAFFSAFKSFAESTPIAWQTVTNSTTSMRRAPPSYLATNDCGLWSRLASSCWVSRALFRASIISLEKALFGTGIRYMLALVAKGPQPQGEHPPEPEGQSGRPARPLSAVPDRIDPAGKRR